jgi:xanthine dehydrogenase molybdopterin-binding subunit B
MACYKSMMITQNFAAACDFLSDPSKTMLNQTLFSVDYLYSNFSQTGAQFAYFIVDNTPFPPNGAQPQGNLTLQTQYAAYVEPSKNYLKLVLTCKHFCEINSS